MKNIDSTLKNIIDKTYLKPIGYQPSSNMIFKNYNKEIFDEDMCIYILYKERYGLVSSSMPIGKTLLRDY